MNGKGSRRRPEDAERVRRNWERIFEVERKRKKRKK